MNQTEDLTSSSMSVVDVTSAAMTTLNSTLLRMMMLNESTQPLSLPLSYYSSSQQHLNPETDESGLASQDESEFLISTIENRPVPTLSIVFAILFSFTFLFGIFTNSIVVLVFAIKSEFRQYTNYFFANLSIADILVLIVCIPVAITDLFSPDIWNYGRVYCKMYYFIEYCVTSVSSLTIIIISVERFFAIASPWTVKQLFNENKSRAAIILIWLFGVTISMPFLSMAEYTEHPDQCQLQMTKGHIIYVCVLNIMLIFVPTIGLAFLYIYIIIKLKDHYKLFVSASPPRGNSVIMASASHHPPHPPHAHHSSLQANLTNNKAASTANGGNGIVYDDTLFLRVHRNNSNNTRKPGNTTTTTGPNRIQLKATLNGGSGTTTMKVSNEIVRPLLTTTNENVVVNNNTDNRNSIINNNRSCSICLSGHGKRCSCLTSSVAAKNNNNTNNSNNKLLNIPNSPQTGLEAKSSVGCGVKDQKDGLNLPRTSNKRSHSFHHFNNTNANNNNNNSRKIAEFDSRPKFRRSTIYKTSGSSLHNAHNLSTTKFNFTIVISFITLIFFCCQLPCRIFLLWSYLKHYFAPPPPLTVAENGEELLPMTLKNDLFYINLVSHLTTLIYFLHCISNPIIYNILSIKFRKAFLSMTTFNKAPDCRLSFRLT